MLAPLLAEVLQQVEAACPAGQASSLKVRLLSRHTCLFTSHLASSCCRIQQVCSWHVTIAEGSAWLPCHSVGQDDERSGLQGAMTAGVPPAALFKEAVYNAVGQSSFGLHGHVDFTPWFRGPLLQVCSCLNACRLVHMHTSVHMCSRMCDSGCSSAVFSADTCTAARSWL